MRGDIALTSRKSIGRQAPEPAGYRSSTAEASVRWQVVTRHPDLSAGTAVSRDPGRLSLHSNYHAVDWITSLSATITVVGKVRLGVVLPPAAASRSWAYENDEK